MSADARAGGLPVARGEARARSVEQADEEQPPVGRERDRAGQLAAARPAYEPPGLDLPRTAPVASLGQAQADLDRWALAVSDRRKRRGATIAELAAQEGLLALPAVAFPAQLEVDRVVSRTALVAFEGNRYSVPPGHIGQTVTVRARLGELHLEIVSAAGRRIARHRRAPAGAGQLLQSPKHARLLERAVLDAFTTDPQCRRKANRPPGTAALAEAARLRGHDPAGVVVDLEDYARIARVAR